MEGIVGNKRISIAALHLEGPALHWHKRFKRDFAGRANITWEVYCDHIRLRFEIKQEALTEKLKNLRQVGSVREYTNAFNTFLTKVGQ